MTIALDHFRAAPVHELTLTDIPLRYRVFGEGQPVLLLHGWPLSGVTYRHLIEALRPHYRCYVPDLPGAGDTPWSPSIRDSTRGYTELMRAFVERLGLDRFAIVAHDSGGGVARLLAAELGSRVTCLVLQNTELPDHVPFMVRVLKAALSSAPTTALLIKLMKQRWFLRSDIGFGACFGDRSLIEGEFYEACIAPLEHNIAGHAAMATHLDLGWTRSLHDAHARITAPIHFFWGEADPYFPMARARKVFDSLAQRGQLSTVPGAKLYVHEEAHERLARFTLLQLARAFTGESVDTRLVS